RQLAQVSQSEIDEVTAEKVQVVTGLLIRYQGLIQDAFRGGAGTVLAQANMRWAHRFMEEEVLSQLATLEQNVEDAEVSAIPWWRHLLWVLPLAAFLGLLGWVQVWHSRRFRRTLSAPLLAASLLAMALGATAVVSLRFDGDVDRSRDTLDDMVVTYEARAEEARFRGCDALKQISGQWPVKPDGDCPRPPKATSGQQLLSTSNSVSTTAASAATYSARATAAAVAMAVLAGLAVTLGLLPRLEEYRYQR
ncbi:hypothetical protein AB0M20_20000, partial [Actinoplanes sp. NPDC051633]|uniref:hypothetical protein n=1 Tax=Actinoplanes sp. NPDC051633 TaxID=3155670 RepID=UPI00341D88D7